jgi:hypothetical protein
MRRHLRFFFISNSKNRERQGTADEEKERFIMALTRRMLKAMGIEDEKIDQIIDAHTETVDALKEERDDYKKDADKLPGVQKELDDLKKDGGDWQKKYEKEHTDFEAYKNEQTAKATKATKDAAFRALLKEAGIPDKRLDVIMKVTNLDEIELDESGKIKDASKHTDTVKTEYADFIVTTTERGADVATPPAGAPKGDQDLGSLSMKDYIAARQKK